MIQISVPTVTLILKMIDHVSPGGPLRHIGVHMHEQKKKKKKKTLKGVSFFSIRHVKCVLCLEV